MSDVKVDASQLVNGVAILLSFYVGYKYGAKITRTQSLSGSSTSSDVQVSDDNVTQLHGQYKMILVVRNDLKMGKGKIGAQCGHAAVGAYQIASKKIPHIVRRWENSGSMKVAVKVESEQELLHIQRAARENNIVTCLIRDAGRTQVEPNSKTVLAIGPAYSNDIDRITGHLKLL